MKNGENDEVVINITALFGLLRYKKEIPFIDLDASKEGISLKTSKVTSFEGKSISTKKERLNITTLIENQTKYKEIFSYFIKKIQVTQLISQIHIGSSNVFVTTIAFNFIHFIYALLYTNIDAKYLLLRVHPSFDKDEFKVYFKTAFNIKIKNFLYLIKYYKIFSDNRKVGVENEQY
ncbi:hypothetical protein [Alkalithermobacter thermoalcaliphilus]|uniref:hypothetical protein n=1 Tax=Clostridium paradoxum TaxID=29346 RepID=UPI00122D05E0